MISKFEKAKAYFTLKYGKYRKIHSGYHSLLIKPLQIDGPEGIAIGDQTYIAEGAWLFADTVNGASRIDSGSSDAKDSTACSLRIGAHCEIGHFAHIVAKQSVTIEDSVLFADKVFVSDCTHEFADIEKPVLNQPVTFIKEVTIGEGSWLGENVCVLGASIGKHCIIGSNAVVTKDIPDYSIAVGSPARVIRHYDFEKKEWVR